jgi:hypothetical protein
VSQDKDKFYRIVSELNRLLIPGLGEGFWSARSIFAEMDRSFLNGWAISGVEEILDGKEFHAFRDRNALTINVTKGYAISLAVIGAQSSGIIGASSNDLFLYPQHYMARNVGAAPIALSQYRPDRPMKNDIYDPDVRLELQSKSKFAPGESLERNGHTDVLDWDADGATGLVLRLHSESLGDYEWVFDRISLAPKGVTVLDSFSSQVTTAMQMLTALNVPVGQDFIEMGLSSPHFHVRWETIKMINRLAPQQTPEAIERLRNDPHPAIRRAAEKTLASGAKPSG